MKIINLISGPRNLSTALMYSFSRRPDTKVIDEPFYAHYLETTGIEHPGREDTLNSMSSDITEVLESIYETSECEVLFLKNMAHHHQQMGLEFLHKMTNLFLVRNPKQLIASFAQVINRPTMQDIGLQKSWELFNKIENKNPVVLDSAEILKNPKILLSKLCDNLEIHFMKRCFHGRLEVLERMGRGQSIGIKTFIIQLALQNKKQAAENYQNTVKVFILKQ